MRHSYPKLAPLTLAFALALGTPALAAAQAGDAYANRSVSFSIAAQPLGQALNELARQAGLQLLFAPALVAGKNAPAVSGNLTPRDAAQRLLSGSGLQAVPEGGAIVVKPSSTDAQTLAPVTVSGYLQTATGPLDGYVATVSATATKTDTPLIETPQSISIVGAQEIEVIKAQDLNEALGYVAGVGRKSGQTRLSDELLVRGFEVSAYTGSMYRDGSKYSVNVYNGQQEPYGLERVELLKGASSVLYGASGPGGIVNTVTKRPTTETLRELNLEYGSFDRKQMSGDFGGALTDDGVWSYRATFLARDSKTATDYIDDDRRFLAGGLSWRPSARTSLTLLADYQKDETAENLGLPAKGTVYSTRYGRIPLSRYTGTPGYDSYEAERYAAGWLFEHAFNDTMTLRNNVRYYDFRSTFPETLTYNLGSDERTSTTRYALDRSDDSQAVVADSSLQFKLGEGMFKHTAIVGVDYTRMKHQTARDQRRAQPFDYFDPDYSFPVGGVYRTQGKSTDRNRRLGFYAQDQLKIADRLVVLLGGRYDEVVYNSHDNVGVSQSIDDEKSRAFTGRGGLVYLFDNGLAPFLSYSESFEPESGTDRTGGRFKPVTGEQYEAGLRYQPPGSDFMLSAALYQLKRKNVSVSDPVDPSYNIQVGEVRSRGFELEARGRIGRNTNVIAAYAYTDARTTKASPLAPDEEGMRVGQVPYHQFSLWTDYSFGDFGLAGLKVGAGLRFVDTTHFLYGTGKVPAYTLYDAMVSYSTGPWRFALNASNLTDKRYVAVCQSACFYGEPRRIIGSVSYRW
jgi:iron complex outermembrane receptor protein